MAATKIKKLSISARLRTVLTRLDNAGWDVGTVSYNEIVRLAKKNIKNADEREAFAPKPPHVSIIKRDFTKGSPTGKRGRPSHASLGMVEAEAA